MALKKKGNKKGDDDWEAEVFGDDFDPIAAATQDAKDADAAKDVEEDGATGGGGGLLAALKKNKQNKKKKGKIVEDDIPEGEDTTAEDGLDGFANDALVNGAKAAEEANADDLFAAPAAKGKGGKGKPGKKSEPAQADADGSDGEGGGLKSKKEKEKEKKEREKQRKKEQVRQIRNVHKGQDKGREILKHCVCTRRPRRRLRQRRQQRQR